MSKGKIIVLSKGCSNLECVVNRKHEKLEERNKFCYECGQKLFYVCSCNDCYNELQDIHKNVCGKCESEELEKKREQKTKRDKIMKDTGDVVKSVGEKTVKVIKAAPDIANTVRGAEGAVKVITAVAKRIIK